MRRTFVLDREGRLGAEITENSLDHIPTSLIFSPVRSLGILIGLIGESSETMRERTAASPAARRREREMERFLLTGAPDKCGRFFPVRVGI